jgi:hypothetical protein
MQNAINLACPFSSTDSSPLLHSTIHLSVSIILHTRVEREKGEREREREREERERKINLG